MINIFPAITNTIGILGGMGPGAGAFMLQTTINLAQTEFQAVQDTDYPPILLYSLPLHGFNETGITDGPLVLQQLTVGLQVLAGGGASVIAMACNSVHVFFHQLQQTTAVPLVNMVTETAAAAAGHHTVGVLCSRTTNQRQLDPMALDALRVQSISASADQQHQIDQAILHVMAGTVTPTDSASLSAIIQGMAAAGATAVILGCTELPLIPLGPQPVPLIDAVTVTAGAVLKKVYQQ
ncbi:MAG: aspartate/glutamate racemase family protein [Patescibacteria group bacterium]